MKPKKWEKRKTRNWGGSDWLAAGIVVTVAMLVFIKLFVFAPVFEVLSGTAGYAAVYLFLLAAVVCFATWALYSGSRWCAVWRTAGVLLAGGAFAFLWFMLWHPEAAWTLAIPFQTAALGYAVVTGLCFAAAALPVGKK